MEIDQKIHSLRYKIEERICGINHNSDNELTAKELKDILCEQISKYNIILMNKVEKDTKVLNRKIAQLRLTNKKVPYIDSITPTIYEDGSEELVIAFSYNNVCKGFAIVSKNLDIRFEFMQKGYSTADILKVLEKNVVNFITYFYAMDSFRHEYPGFGYVWNRNEENPYYDEINDGFIYAKFDLDDISYTRASLAKIEDLQLARFRTKKYGELYDYVDFFNDRILDSLIVDEEELNPLYRQMLNRYRSENKGNSRRLKVR